jgi:hypothetical protein
MLRELRQECIKLIQASMAPTQAAVRNSLGASANRVQGLSLAGSATIPLATTTGSALCVMLADLPVLASGLFDVRISAAVTGITTTNSVDWLVSTDFLLPNSGAVVSGGTSFGGAPTGSSGKLFTNHGVAAGVTYTAGHTGAPGVAMYDTGAQVVVTPALDQMFSFVGTVGASLSAAGNPVPFTKGNFALIGLYTTISIGSAAPTWQGLSVDIVERNV